MRASAVISFAVCCLALLVFAGLALDHLLAGTTMPAIDLSFLGAAIIAAIIGATLLVLRGISRLRNDIRDLTIAGRGADEFLAIRHRIQHR